MQRKTLVLILLSSLGVFSGSLLAPIEARFLQMIVHDTFLIGTIFAVGTIFTFIFSVIVGRKSVAWGKRKAAIFGLFVGIFYPVIYATSLNIFQCFLGKIASAFAGAASWNMINAIFQDMLKRNKRAGEISGYKFSAQSIAGAFGAITSGLLADYFGIKAPFVVVSVAYFVVLLVFLKEFPVSEESITAVQKRSVKTNLGRIFENPYLFFRFFTEGVTQSHWAMEPIVFPLAIYSLTHSNTATGIVFAGMGVIAMFALPLTGRLADKFGVISSLKLAFFFYSFSLFLLSFANSFFTFFIAALLLSLGKTFNGPAIAKIEIEHIENRYRGEFLGYFYAYDTITGAIAALVTGFMLKFLAPQKVFLIFACFTVIAFIIGYLLFLKKKQSF